MKKQLFSKRLRLGSYSLLLSAIVLVAVIVLNLIVSSLPTKYTTVDLSPSAVTELGDTTRAYADALSTDVTLYRIVSSGSEDNVITTILRHYGELSDHIHVKSVDPVTNPTFLSTYEAENVKENSIIVVSSADETRFKVLPYDDLFEYYIAEFDEFFPYDQANEYYQFYAMYYQTELTVTQYFKGERMITSALDFVTSSDLPHIYVLTGHGEYALDPAVISMLEADNLIVHTDFSLIAEGSVPENADVLLISMPRSDLGAEESELLSGFIDRGGAVLLVTGYEPDIHYDAMPHLLAVTSKMGLTAKAGFLCDEDKNHFTYYNYYNKQCYALLPTVNLYGPLSLLEGAESETFLLLNTHPIAALPGYEGKATVSPILSSSDKGYIKLDISSVTRADADEVGSFYMGAVSELTPEDGGQAGRLVWYSSHYVLADLYANRDLFICTANYLAGRETSISIGSKLLEASYLQPMTAGQVNAWSAVIIFVIPGFILAGGFFVWLRRRRR